MNVTSMNIVEMMAGELNYLNASGRPKVTALRNVRRVKSSQHSAGYSFIFEAEINGGWKTYGPDVNGNWTVEHGKSHRLPATDLLWRGTDTSTIDIGWYALNEFFANLPLEE